MKHDRITANRPTETVHALGTTQNKKTHMTKSATMAFGMLKDDFQDSKPL
jgi:hypothetical protein